MLSKVIIRARFGVPSASRPPAEVDAGRDRAERWLPASSPRSLLCKSFCRSSAALGADPSLRSAAMVRVRLGYRAAGSLRWRARRHAFARVSGDAAVMAWERER